MNNLQLMRAYKWQPTNKRVELCTHSIVPMLKCLMCCSNYVIYSPRVLFNMCNNYYVFKSAKTYLTDMSI